MTTSELVCLFHNRKYACNLQRILNLLRADLATNDLNHFAKRSLCTCPVSSNRKIIKYEAFNTQKTQFDELQNEPWYEEVNRIIENHIIRSCSNRTCIYKLYRMICQMYQREKNLPSIESPHEAEEISTGNGVIRRQMELTLRVSQLGHLLGREGYRHKQIMKETNTQIHFDNAPYSSNSKSCRSSGFDLESFQSAAPLRATITGHSAENVQKAIEALQILDRATQDNLRE